MNFTLKKVETIQGKLTFYELYKDGRSLLQEFITEIESSHQHKSEYLTIMTYMELVANNESVPITKYRPLKGNKDGINEFEFKSKHLRIYLIHLAPHGKIILLGGYKKEQTSDIKKFRSLKKQYLDNLNR